MKIHPSGKQVIDVTSKLICLNENNSNFTEKIELKNIPHIVTGSRTIYLRAIGDLLGPALRDMSPMSYFILLSIGYIF